MGAGQSMAMQHDASSGDGWDFGGQGFAGEDTEVQDARRLRWILQVVNDPESCQEHYTGDEQDGMRHGHGAAFYTSGDVYEGQWHRGLWQGRGTLTYMSGARYSGYFDRGEQHGRGEFLDVNGVRFRGEFRRGRRHGPGFMVSTNGARFEGWFRDGVPNGEGVLTWPDGGKFVGKYVAGKEHGRGSVLDPEGNKVCDVECAAGVLVGGRTVCPGTWGGGKGPKCRGGSQSCGFCLQTALDLELSISHDHPNALEALSGGAMGGSGMRSGNDMIGTSQHRRSFSGAGSSRHPSNSSLSSRQSGGGWGLERSGHGLGGGKGTPSLHRCLVRVKARPSDSISGHVRKPVTET